MSKHSTEVQLNAMTTLMSSLLRTLNENNILTDHQVVGVVENAVAMCERSSAEAGAKAYLEETYLQNVDGRAR